MEPKISQAISFALCLSNEGYNASLDVGKLYRIVQDAQADAHGLIRIVDESGEDYAFAADRFYRLQLPQPIEAALLAGTRS